MIHAAGPVEDGFITSLARPGGNITGLSMTAGPELLAKRLEILNEMLPRLSRAAVLRQADVLVGWRPILPSRTLREK